MVKKKRQIYFSVKNTKYSYFTGLSLSNKCRQVVVHKVFLKDWLILSLRVTEDTDVMSCHTWNLDFFGQCLFFLYILRLCHGEG